MMQEVIKYGMTVDVRSEPVAEQEHATKFSVQAVRLDRGRLET